MSQQGQLIRLKRKGRDGEPVWAYRYRVGGRGSKRVQQGGFASERDAAEALERDLERVGCTNSAGHDETLVFSGKTEFAHLTGIID